jgi:bacteriorhodopsin
MTDLQTQKDIKGLNPVVGDEKSKIEKRVNPIQYYVKFSFSITYIFLLTTATITFIEAMRTSSPTARHVLNLETAISIIAGYFYSTFLEKISAYEKDDKIIDWADMTATRYIDWSMTTPLMLLALCVVLAQNIGKSVTLKVIMGVIVLNFIMLYLGHLGEVKRMDRLSAMLFGFVAFFGMFYLIFTNYVAPKYVKSNYILFGFFVIVWGLYGVVYMLNEEYKNITMNILDCIAKCFVGLGLWAYFSKIVVLQ